MDCNVSTGLRCVMEIRTVVMVVMNTDQCSVQDIVVS